MSLLLLFLKVRQTAFPSLLNWYDKKHLIEGAQSSSTSFDASKKNSVHANHTFYFLCFELIPQLFLTKHNTENVHALLGKKRGCKITAMIKTKVLSQVPAAEPASL